MLPGYPTAGLEAEVTRGTVSLLLVGQNVRVSELTEIAQALTADLIADGNQAVGPVISPDGRRVAWTAFRMGERERQVRELWLAPVGEGAVPARLSDGSVPARLPCWSLDSAWLFYVAGEELRRLRITADGSAGVAEPVLRWRGEISGVVPLTGGQRVAVVAGDERPRMTSAARPRTAM